MTYDTSRIDDSRQPITVLELYLDDCANTYGSTPCTAALAAGSECFNTYNTCQDTANYDKTSKTYRFYQPVNNWPVGELGYPCIDGNPVFTPCEIDTKGSLGKRGVATIKLNDFADDDIYTDPYFSTRSYDPESQGTFFTKLKARTPYYKGRLMKVRQGYINSTFSWTDFEDRLYVIDSINVDIDGKVRITGKDLFDLANNTKAVMPAANTETLAAAYTIGGTTLVLQTGEGASFTNDPYTGSAISGSLIGYARIGDNVLKYTGVSTDTLTGVVGGQWGSTDDDADIDDGVQQCLHYNIVNVVDIIHHALTTYAGITETYIPYDAGLTVPTGTDDEWDIEKGAWLSLNDLTYLVTKPTGVNKMMEKICVQNLIYMWADERSQEIKLKAIAPEINNGLPPYLNDDSHIIKKSIKARDNVKGRISQIWVYYDIKDITADLDKAENYKKLKITVDTDSENTNAYDEPAIKIIYADWLSSANAGLILTLSGRLLSRYSGTPSNIQFKLDKKDADIWTGNNAILNSRAFVDETGANKRRMIKALKVKDDHEKQILTIDAESWSFDIFLYAYIAPNTMGDYLAESDANRAAYGFIAANTGLMSNGDQGYYIA